jgi:hypothetical protein
MIFNSEYELIVGAVDKRLIKKFDTTPRLPETGGMQTSITPTPRIVLVFQSKRGGLFYWAGSVQAENWPKQLKYRTMVLVPRGEAQ